MSTNLNYVRRRPQYVRENSLIYLKRNSVNGNILKNFDGLQKIELKYNYQLYYKNRLNPSEEANGIFSRDFILFLMTAFEDFEFDNYVYRLTPAFNNDGTPIPPFEKRPNLYNSDGNLLSEEVIKYSIDVRNFLTFKFSKLYLGDKTYRLNPNDSLPVLVVANGSTMIGKESNQYVFINSNDDDLTAFLPNTGITNLYIYTNCSSNIMIKEFRDYGNLIPKITLVLPNFTSITKDLNSVFVDNFELICPALLTMNDAFNYTFNQMIKNLNINAPKLREINNCFDNLFIFKLYINSPQLSVINNSIYNCEQLTDFVLTGTPQIIGDNFLSSCQLLRILRIDLSKVESIGSSFLANTTELPQFDMNLPLLKTLGGDFLEGCRWRELNLKMPVLERVGIKGSFSSFIYKFPNLRNLEMSCPRLRELNIKSFYECRRLNKLNLNFPFLEATPNKFISNLYIYSLELNINNVKSLGNSNFKNIWIYSINLNLPLLESIGDSCFKSMDRLMNFSLKAPLLKTVTNEFLYSNRSLKEINLELRSLQRLGNYCFSYNGSLKKITLLAPKLNSVQKNFMRNNPRLKIVTLDAPKLNYIGSNWFKKSKRLKKLNLKLGKVDNRKQNFLEVPDKAKNYLKEVTFVGTGLLSDSDNYSSSDF